MSNWQLAKTETDPLVCPRCGRKQWVLIDFEDGFGMGCMDRSVCLSYANGQGASTHDKRVREITDELVGLLPDCVLCNEPMGAEKSASVAQLMHRACALRSGIGGIGHLLDHKHFCVELHDPDAGLSFRTSALLVDEYVARVGVERATSEVGDWMTERGE